MKKFVIFFSKRKMLKIYMKFMIVLKRMKSVSNVKKN